VTARATACH